MAAGGTGLASQGIITAGASPALAEEDRPGEVLEAEELSRQVELGSAADIQGVSTLGGWVASEPLLVTMNRPDQVTLHESTTRLETTLYQDFLIPEGAKRLAFTISGLTYDSLRAQATTPDAFGVALVN